MKKIKFLILLLLLLSPLKVVAEENIEIETTNTMVENVKETETKEDILDEKEDLTNDYEQNDVIDIEKNVAEQKNDNLVEEDLINLDDDKKILEEYYAADNINPTSNETIDLLNKIRELVPSTLNFDVNESYVVEEFGKTDDMQKRLVSLVKDKISSILQENGYGTLDDLGFDVRISYWSSFYDAYIEIYAVGGTKNTIILREFSYLNTNEQKDAEIDKKILERTNDGFIKKTYEEELGNDISDYNPNFEKEKEYVENIFKDLGVTIYYANPYTSDNDLNKSNGFIFYLFLNDKFYKQGHYSEEFIPYVIVSDDVVDTKNYVKEKIEEYLKSKNVNVENGYIETNGGYNYYTDKYIGRVNVRYNEEELNEIIDTLESGITLNKTEYDAIKTDSDVIEPIIKEEIENVLKEKNFNVENFLFDINPYFNIYSPRNISLNFNRDNYSYKSMNLKITYLNTNNYKESIQKEVDTLIKGLNNMYEEYVLLEEDLPENVEHLEEYLDNLVNNSNIPNLNYIIRSGLHFENELYNLREDNIVFFVDQVFYGTHSQDSCVRKKVIVPHTSLNIVEDGLDLVKKYLLAKGVSYINESTTLTYENNNIYYNGYGYLGKIKIEKEKVKELEADINEKIVALNEDINDLIVTIKYDYNKFIRVLLNDEVLDEANYTVHEGSTIITLKPEFIATLPVGEYKLDIIFTDGEAEATFEILDTKVIKGDLNFDKKIDIIDVKLLLLETFNTHADKDYLLMDMNDDGNIDIVDVKLLLLETFNIPKTLNTKAMLAISFDEVNINNVDNKKEIKNEQLNNSEKFENLEEDKITNSICDLELKNIKKYSEKEYENNDSYFVIWKKEEEYL